MTKVKTSIADLALFGGPPAFNHTLHVGRPNIGDRDRLMGRINDLLDRRWFTNAGVFEKEFEARIQDLLQVEHCVVMSNGTIALEIAIRALGLEGEVIVPSFTFIATAHALQWQEVTPVFCDVRPGSHHIDPAQIERLITPRTSGIIGVHVWGIPCDVEAMENIAARRGLSLLFDAAHAFSCTAGGRRIGSFGDAEVLSFHATKFLNSFEGGAVTTKNAELAAKLRHMRNFGFAGTDRVDSVGTNGKMTEICAAMGLTSLESIDEIIAVNRNHYAIYLKNLGRLPGVRLVRYDEQEVNNYHYVILEIDTNLAGISRDVLVRTLHAENVFARRYFYPGCHQMEPYRSYFPHSRLLLPFTESLVTRVISLPNGTGVTAEEVQQICDVINFAVGHGDEITLQLNQGTPLMAN